MTPARLAEIRAYIDRLDLNQLPGWTVEQRIIQDLWETLQGVRARVVVDVLSEVLHDLSVTSDYKQAVRWIDQRREEYLKALDAANPYRDGEQQ